MIEFNRYVLDNGLRLIVHEDRSTQLAVINLLYDVGARDEDPERTGFAHLFEHLMFEGSENIPHYDRELEVAGGVNNAFTTNDVTNYYLSLPATNLETGMWLESDRMLSLAFSGEKLGIQKNVVIEEYKQRYLNQPYGDAWLHLRPLAYKVHPYRWPTIGREIAHIENATLDDVRSFFYTWYRPDNAILTVAGNVRSAEVRDLAEKWFGAIPPGKRPERNLPQEPEQREARTMTVSGPVPYDALYMSWHTAPRSRPGFYAADLLSDILSGGKSSRLYRALVQERRLFSELGAYTNGELDNGMFVVSGKLVKGVAMEAAETAVREELDRLRREPPSQRETEKVRNKIESSLRFGYMDVLNKAMDLCYFELFGDAGLINREAERYLSVTAGDLHAEAQALFDPVRSSTMYYRSEKSSA